MSLSYPWSAKVCQDFGSYGGNYELISLPHVWIQEIRSG